MGSGNPRATPERKLLRSTKPSGGQRPRRVFNREGTWWAKVVTNHRRVQACIGSIVMLVLTGCLLEWSDQDSPVPEIGSPGLTWRRLETGLLQPFKQADTKLERRTRPRGSLQDTAPVLDPTRCEISRDRSRASPQSRKLWSPAAARHPPSRLFRTVGTLS